MLKVIKKKLAGTQTKVSGEWSKYRKVKQKVLSRKSLTKEEKKQVLSSERDLTYKRISERYKDYREFKYSKIYHSPYEGFRYVNTLKQPYSIQKIYKAQKNYDVDNLDSLIPDVLEEKGVTGILIVFSVTDEEGNVRYVSNYITKGLLDRMYDQPDLESLWNEGAIFEYVTQRINAGYVEKLTLKFIYLRVIYEKSKMLKGNN